MDAIENSRTPKTNEQRRSLDKMRSKLVTATERTAGRPGARLLVPADSGAFRRRMSAIVVIACVAIAGANVYAFFERDDLLARIEPMPKRLPYAQPPAKWSVDERAMYLAYAAYNPSKFDARFGQVPETHILNRKLCAKKLDELLLKGGLNPIVMSEINDLLKNRDSKRRTR